MTLAKHPRVRLQHMLENIDGLIDATAGLPINTIRDNFEKRSLAQSMEDGSAPLWGTSTINVEATKERTQALFL